MGGGCTHPFTNFFDFFLRDTKNIFCQCYQNYLGHLWLKFFRFSDLSKVVSLAPQRGRCTTPHKSKGVFSDILTTASRTNTLYGLETRYIQSSRHVGIIKKVLRLIRHFDVFMTSSMSDFYVNLQFLGYSKYHKVCRNSWFSHIICVLIGSIHLMCNRLCVDEKLPFLVLGKWWTFSSTCSTYPIIITFYQQVNSMKRSKLTKFQDGKTSIDELWRL